MLEDDGLNITEKTNNPAESMNAKVKKHEQSGQQVDRVIQQLKQMALGQGEELQKASKNLSHQFIHKLAAVEETHEEHEVGENLQREMKK